MKNLTRFIALICSVTAVFHSHAQVPDTNHTVIRFDVFSAGTNFGKLDIELFDQEKPETVRNFLLYVYSGAYSNLVLHRLAPNFVVQAGHIRIEDPASTNAFTSYPALTNFGRITNEYSVGPELTNGFGTIAMARVSGQTNSATTDWFINLTNNPHLNTADGGFTVFGRVVNTMDDRSGTNLLKYFNTLSSGNGIRSASTTNPVESLSNLPVITNRAGAPIYSDLFTIQASFIQGGKPHDVIAPTVEVINPPNAFTTTTNSTLTISGIAADNQGIARVLYDAASGKSLIANGTTNWTVELALSYGTNRFTVRSVDEFGNVSTNVERVIVRGTPPPATNHTVVRFDIFAAGTNFGKLDIELFDQEKPETVKNFLLYVYSGAYSNLVFHRLAPKFVVQAGHIRVDDPASTNVFASYPVLSDFGKITNEYGVGPELSNDFGTIAMARIPGQTNSANTDWFINLTNNPFLNTVDGGFTVFGRVVNETDERSGIFLLNYLNTLSSGQGVRSASITNPLDSLPELPVVTNRAGAPIYADLFTIQASFVQGGLPHDVVAPTIAVTQPAVEFSTSTNSTVTITGTAADNQDIARVLYDTSAGKSLFANGKTSWSVELPLDFGTNRFSFRSVDNFGNVSATVERVIVREERPPDAVHTVVRFDISTNGVQFGRLDVELYDDVKPETVRNFLMYVYSGAYSNLIVQDVQPNRILQAGSAHPDGTNGFSRFIYEPVVNLGATVDEYATGGQQRNEFGTLATARVPGANSASNAWHINLANNTSLDSDPGGSTVFGRVVNTVDDRSGINLLRFFNTFQSGVNLRAVSQFGELGALQVPVTAFRVSAFPYTADMFLIRASIIQGGAARDNIAPIVQINEPTDTSVILTTNETVTIAGTAVDNQQIVRVLYDTPSGVAFPADGKENWSKQISLVPGTNRITVRAVDEFGNMGMAERTFFRSRLQRVALRIEGKGTVTGITNGQSFLVGVNYTFKAKPAARQYFLGWRANEETDISETDSELTFPMPEELTNVVAVFSRTFLGLTNGAYRGLFFPITNGPPRSSGTLSVNLAANGFYSGRLAPLGSSYGISGKFDPDGTDLIQDPSGLLGLYLVLYPDETIRGFYSSGQDFMSEVGLRHVEPFTRSSPAPLAGVYSFLISPTAVVSGYGFGNATIDALGRIKMKGTLADGTPIKQNSALLAGDVWPFYASAKAGRKVVLGNAFFNSNKVVHANARWFDSTFPGNTNQVARLDGSPYVPPSQGRLFNWTNGVMSLSGGGLQAAIFANVILNEDGSFTFSSNPNNIQLGIPDAKGLITGSFAHPVTSALTPLKGAVLQSSNMAAGFFLNGTTSGAFVIRGN